MQKRNKKSANISLFNYLNANSKLLVRKISQIGLNLASVNVQGLNNLIKNVLFVNSLGANTDARTKFVKNLEISFSKLHPNNYDDTFDVSNCKSFQNLLNNINKDFSESKKRCSWNIAESREKLKEKVNISKATLGHIQLSEDLLQIKQSLEDKLLKNIDHKATFLKCYTRKVRESEPHNKGCFERVK